MRGTAIAIVSLLAFASTARATSTVYTDRAAWEAAVGGSIYTESFDSLSPQANDPATGGTMHTPMFDIVSSPRVHGSGSIHDGYFGSDLHTELLYEYDDFVFYAPTVAFGVDVLAVEEASGLRFTIGGESFGHPTLTDANGYPIPGTTFFGVVSGTPFTTVRISSGGQAPRFYRLDNVSFAVPEPGALALLVVTLVRWRQRS